MIAERGSLRERRRVETRRAIQSHAMRLFVEDGYDSTTVAEVARAAGVSAMTVYRHFPTKEDLVLWDEYDLVIADRLAALPAEGSLVQRIGRALVDAAGIAVGPGDDTAGGASPGGAAPKAGKELLLARLRLMLSTPALRARHWDTQFATQKAIVDALRTDPPDPAQEFRSWAVAGACWAALNVAVMRWAEEDGRPDLAGLVAAALTAAFDEEFR